jgi:hypothetical protein
LRPGSTLPAGEIIGRRQLVNLLSTFGTTTGSGRTAPSPADLQVRRRDVLGELTHEYELAAVA